MNWSAAGVAPALLANRQAAHADQEQQPDEQAAPGHGRSCRCRRLTETTLQTYQIWYARSGCRGGASSWSRRSRNGSSRFPSGSSVVWNSTSTYWGIVVPCLTNPTRGNCAGSFASSASCLSSRGASVRVSYWIITGRRIILLTVFRKQRRQERAEIERAYKAMQRCIEESHVAEEDDGETA